MKDLNFIQNCVEKDIRPTIKGKEDKNMNCPYCNKSLKNVIDFKDTSIDSEIICPFCRGVSIICHEECIDANEEVVDIYYLDKM